MPVGRRNDTYSERRCAESDLGGRRGLESGAMVARNFVSLWACMHRIWVNIGAMDRAGPRNWTGIHKMCFLAGPPPLILVPAESQCSTSVAPVRYQQSANAAPEGYKCGTSAVPAQQQRRTKAESVQFHRGASAVLLQERSSISATSV